jgi:tetratricopeptide (TPR) repeat protein
MRYFCTEQYKFIMKRALLYIFFLFAALNVNAQEYSNIVEKALNAAKKDSLVQAEKLFQQALKLDPSNIRNALLFTNLGTVQRRMGKSDEALKSYSLSLNITPYSVVTLLNRASLYLERNNFDKAYIDYCNVLDIDRFNKEALLFRAYINMNRREYKEARIDYNALLSEDNKNRTALIGLIILNQKEQKYREAIESVDRMIVDNPKDVSLLKIKANIEIEMNTLDLALIDLESAAKLSPNDPEIYVTCGDIYMAQKKNREAYVAYEKAVSLGTPRSELRDKLKASK